MSSNDADGAPRLFAVYLGGDPLPGRLSEDHEVVHVVATDVPAARSAARAKWKGSSKPHIDAVQELTVIDGCRIQLVATDELDAALIDPTYEPPEGPPAG